MNIIVFDADGKASSNLCFGAVSHMIRKALAIFGRKKLRNRRRKLKIGSKHKTRFWSQFAR